MQAGIILRALSFLSLVVCVFMLPSAITARVLGESDAFRAFLISYAILAAPAAAYLFVMKKRQSASLTMKTGFLLVFAAWLGIASFSAVPLYLSGAFASAGDAFFEAVSGITTTGATVILYVEELPASILLWRSTCHWMGGMGIIMLTVALVPLLGIGGLQLVQAEQRGVNASKLTSRITETAKYLWLIYTCFTIVCFVLYKVGGMTTFDAVNHAFSSIATGGFSTKNDSMGAFESPYIQWVTIAAMLSGGVSFALYFQLFTGRVVKVFRNTELKVYLSIVAAASVVVVFANYHEGLYTDLGENIRFSVFHVSSLITTTGYSLSDYTRWPNLCQFIFFLLLISGGCAGSTSGGIKIIRIVVIFKQALIEMKQLVHPRGIFLLRLNGHTVHKNIVYSVSGFIILYMLTVMLVTGIATFSGANLVTAFSTGLAMVGNTGLGLENVGPTGTYGFYPEPVKFIFGLAMLVGRLELYTFFVLLTPTFWKR